MARRQSAILSWICGITILSVIKAAGFTTHNTAVSYMHGFSVFLSFFMYVDPKTFELPVMQARRTSQFEYFGPASSTYNPIPFQGLAMSRSDAIQG